MEEYQTDANPRYHGVDELIRVQECLRGYHRSIARKISGHLESSRRVLEFGAGIGTVASVLRDHFKINPACLEIDGDFKQVLNKKGFRVYGGIDEVDELFDGVYAANVLEHIKDDVGALKKIRSVMKPDSVLVVYVPAFMCLYSELDGLVGHYRRYGKRELVSKLSRAGFESVRVHYVDSVGFFAALATRVLGYKKTLGLGSAGSYVFYDRVVYPLSAVLDFLGVRFLFGKNILVVATPKDAGAGVS